MDDVMAKAAEPAQHTQLDRLLARVAKHAPLRTAIVHPCDPISLGGAMQAYRLHLIEPILIGPAGRIAAAALQAGEDLTGIEIIPTEHSHAAAEAACRLARSGKIGAIMKGSLHTDELLQAAVHPDTSLRTDRRMSHVFVFDVPTYPRPLFISDAAINVAPDLAAKMDIVQNAINCAVALGTILPRVAVLAATETVNPDMVATVDAAALAKMADRGQIVGGLVDGPLAFDNAISKTAARLKQIVSQVAGVADVLIVPNIEAGNMIAKQLTYLANAQSAGIVMGARVPIILTSRADGHVSRMASCAAAVLVARHERPKAAR